MRLLLLELFDYDRDPLLGCLVTSLFSIYVSNILRDVETSDEAVAGLHALFGKLICSECSVEQVA
jgi:hypothetical protein